MSTLFIRNLEPGIAQRAKLAARARGLTLAEYISLLVQLHDVIRARADAGSDDLQAELQALGLETVRR